MIMTLTLNAAIDKAYQLPGEVRPGTVMRVASCRNTAGGKGLNVARIVKLCGENVMTSGIAGGKTGELLEQLLARDGLEGRFFHIKGETRCCINVIDERRQSTEFLEPGELVSARELADFSQMFEGLCGAAEVVVMSGSVPKGIKSDIYQELITIARRGGKKVILDTSGDLLKEGIRAAPDMIKPNQEELAVLAGRPVTTLTEIKTAAMELHKKGIGQVVVSMGKEGALLVCGEGVFQGTPPPVQAVNTVGCGDSMVAAFAVAMQRNLSAAEGLKYAVAVSAANALSIQTGYFEKETLEDIYPLVKIQRLTVSDWGGT